MGATKSTPIELETAEAIGGGDVGCLAILNVSYVTHTGLVDQIALCVRFFAILSFFW